MTIDSDGQHDPDQIGAILEPILKDECDIVIGSRFLSSCDRKRSQDIEHMASGLSQW